MNTTEKKAVDIMKRDINDKITCTTQCVRHFVRYALLALLLLMVGVTGVWGQTDLTGYYYIANYNSYNSESPTSNWYLVPAGNPQQSSYIDAYYSPNHNEINGDPEKPFLTTYKTNKDVNSVWKIVPSGEDGYYFVIHNQTGKYVIYEVPLPNESNSQRKTMHLQTIDNNTYNPSNNENFKFAITSSGTGYNIRPKNRSGWYWNPAGSNANTYYGTDTANKDIFYLGLVGLWSGADGNSIWYFELIKKCLSPIISIDENTITITNLTAGATVYYTTDGTAPTTSSDVYSGTIVVDDIKEVRAIAVKDTYENSDEAYFLIKPYLSQECDNKLIISCNNPDATFYYTIDGTDPTTESTLYTEPFTPETGQTIKAVAYIDEVTSRVNTQTYTPAFTPIPTITVSGLTVTITGEGDIYYTTNGNDPEQVEVQKYNGQITLTEGSNAFTLKAMAKNGSLGTSCIVQKTISPAYRVYDLTTLRKVADHPEAAYIMTDDIADASGFDEDITFTGTFDGDYHTITGLGRALFSIVNGGTVKNVILDDVTIGSGTNVGAICNKATGASRIYNCGILSTEDNPSSISGDNYVGGIVGLLEGTSRVINCYSYADITGGSYVGGIVGYNNETSISSAISTMVMNCMFYGEVSGGNISPIYNGSMIKNYYTNDDDKGLNNYNFFRFNRSYVSGINTYNCALGAEDRYLDRFEFFRHTLNSNRELAAWYVTGDAARGKGVNNEMAKWVVDKSIAPYPILKQQGTYPSVVNHDAANAIDIDDKNEHRNEGRKLGTLTVYISGKGANAPAGASITTGTKILNITDKDTEHYDFNYRKVQLPYYNEVGTGNYTHNKVVTGWKISVSGGTTSFTTGVDAPAYNFVDRKCTGKDNYGTSGRVFSQGAYYEVPDGVESISIEPFWADCVYLADASLDVTFKKDYSTEAQFPVQQYIEGNTYEINGDAQVVYTSFAAALTALASTSANTVYNKAIVLVGNYHKCFGEASLSGDVVMPVTVMSADLNGDNEPDYCFFYQHQNTKNVTPIRFDFITVPGIAMVMKASGSSQYPQPGVFFPKGWFEMTNTSLMRFNQFEYGKKSVKQINAPLILMGGIFEQFLSCRDTDAGNTPYIHIGGNAWFNEFNNGCHTKAANKTPKIPISVSGGDFNKFYLSGIYQPGADQDSENAECYIDGGRFGEVAGAGMQVIKGDVTWLINAADISDFYGGGVNPSKPITGNISTTISNSWVNNFYGGPKFGNMTDGKSVSTEATNCHFGNFFGAGYGGNAYNRIGTRDVSTARVTTANWNSYISSDYSRAYVSKGDTVGISTSYDYEYIIHSNTTQKVGRFFVNLASLSLATTHNVTSTLTGCEIDSTFFGGGNLGSVIGDVTSTLNNCSVEGSAYGAGFSATTPKIIVLDKSNFKVVPFFNDDAGVFNDDQVQFSDSVTYTWSDDASLFILTGESPNYFYDNGTTHLIYTDQNLHHLGTVTGKVTLNITGNTLVKGNVYNVDGTIKEQSGGVFGGGDASGVTGNTEVNINASGQKSEGYNVYNVYGGGNSAPVTGNTEVNLKGKSIINGDVFGGGNEGLVSGSTTVNIK